MRYLVDTHVLLWQSDDSPRLTKSARELLSKTSNHLFFSVASLWELVIKGAKGDADFRVDVAELREGLLTFGYEEISVTADHVLEVARLAPLHGDPFDRLLLAQARVESMVLLTADRAVLAYGAPAESV